MKQTDAIQKLREYDNQYGKYVYLTRDLKKLFGENENTLKRTIQRLTKSGILEHAAHGVYMYALSTNIGEGTLDSIARNLRRGEFTYESYESALSAYGVISQIPIDRRTYATTGRSGEYRTPYGVIEFTHTKSEPARIIEGLCRYSGRKLPVASKQLAWKNLRSAHRNLDLVDLEELNADA